MSTNRLTVLTVAVVAFALFETWVAYDDRTDGANIIWAGFAWVYVLFVGGLWWESARTK